MRITALLLAGLSATALADDIPVVGQQATVSIALPSGAAESGSLLFELDVGANYEVRDVMVIDVPQSGELTCSARPIKFGHELSLKKRQVQCEGPPRKLSAPAKPPATKGKRGRTGS